jgi:hypothetical protein
LGRRFFPCSLVLLTLRMGEMGGARTDVACVKPLRSPGAAELQYKVVRAMGVDTTLEDWILFRKKTDTWSVKFGDLFKEWLSRLAPGSRCGWCLYSDQVLAFVREYTVGKYRYTYGGSN